MSVKCFFCGCKISLVFVVCVRMAVLNLIKSFVIVSLNLWDVLFVFVFVYEFLFFVFVVVILILCDCEFVFVMFCHYLCDNGCILIQNVFMKAKKNTPSLVRNLLLYLDLRDYHTYMNTWNTFTKDFRITIKTIKS